VQQQPYIMNPKMFEQCFRLFAGKLPYASGAAHLAELAGTAKDIPESILAALAAKMAPLGLRVNSTLTVRLREIAVDGRRYDDATDFVRALVAELQRYLDEPEITAAALAELERRLRASTWRRPRGAIVPNSAA
jgi:hypothetical protein